jgi:hypothetical protein
MPIPNPTGDQFSDMGCGRFDRGDEIAEPPDVDVDVSQPFDQPAEIRVAALDAPDGELQPSACGGDGGADVGGHRGDDVVGGVYRRFSSVIQEPGSGSDVHARGATAASTQNADELGARALAPSALVLPPTALACAHGDREGVTVDPARVLSTAPPRWPACIAHREDRDRRRCGGHDRQGGIPGEDPGRGHDGTCHRERGHEDELHGLPRSSLPR